MRSILLSGCILFLLGTVDTLYAMGLSSIGPSISFGPGRADTGSTEQKIYFLLRSRGLTDKEAEVALLISQHISNRELA